MIDELSIDVLPALPKKEKRVDTSFFEWTPERETCLEMFLQGISVKQIAQEIGKPRHLIYDWVNHPVFIETATRAELERRANTKQRRVFQNSYLAEKLAKASDKALESAMSSPHDQHKRNAAKDFIILFEKLQNLESVSTGQSTGKGGNQTTVNIINQQNPLGFAALDQPQQSTPHASLSLKRFLESALPTIEVENIKTETAQDLLLTLTQEALVHSDILESLHKDDSEV